MSEESTTPDPVELVRRAFEAANRRVRLAAPATFDSARAWVFVWVRGFVARLTVLEVDEARAAAERLAGS